MKNYHLTLTIEEVRALKTRLIPISPAEYDIETYALLRNLYGRLDHFDIHHKDEQAPLVTSDSVIDPRD